MTLDKNTCPIPTTVKNVFKVLDISTVHIKPETLKSKVEKNNYLNCMDSDYGSLIWVPEIGDCYNIPWEQDLEDCLNMARKMDCSYILFDCDSYICDELPTYKKEWSDDDE